MTSTSFEPEWQWPRDLPGRWADDYGASADFPNRTEPSSYPVDPAGDTPDDNHHPHQDQQDQQDQQRKFYRPRTCRICLDTVLPTFHPPSETISRVFQSSPSVTYESVDGGRLIRPCLCKGSQKYVHEGCLTAWRLQNPMEKRNYWQCPTCKYNYRLERMTWGRLIGSTGKPHVPTQLPPCLCSPDPRLTFTSFPNRSYSFHLPRCHFCLGLCC